MNALHEDDELGLGDALHAAADQIHTSPEAWSTNVTRVRQRRRTTQVGAVLGAVVIAGGTVTGVALARNHGDGTGQQPTTSQTDAKAPVNVAVGPYAVWHYDHDGEPWTFYTALGYSTDPGPNLGKLSSADAAGPSSRPFAHDMWAGSVITPEVLPGAGRPVVSGEYLDNPDVQLNIGYTRPDVTELTLLVKTKIGSKWSAPRPVDAQIFGRDTGLKAAIYAARFDTNYDQIVRYEGRYASGQTFTYTEK